MVPQSVLLLMVFILRFAPRIYISKFPSMLVFTYNCSFFLQALFSTRQNSKMRFKLPLRTGLRTRSEERLNSSPDSSMDTDTLRGNEPWSKQTSLSIERAQVDPYQNAAHRRLHWLSPLMMVGCLAAGMAFAGGHHAYYSWLDGRVVGDSRRQQWALKYLSDSSL